MDLNDLLEKLGGMLQPEARNKKNYREKLKALLKDLKQKEVMLKEKLEASEDERKRNLLTKELEIVHTQRKKGIEALEDTTKEKKEEKKEDQN